MYSSGNIKDLNRFYQELAKPEEFIEFSSRRQSAEIKTYKYNFENEKCIIVVIPTANILSDRVSRIIKLFSYLPIIVVESSGQFFNFSKSMNRGIEIALEYEPEWILLSNDDIIPLGTQHNLVSILRNSDECDVAVPYLEMMNGSINDSGVCLRRQTAVTELLYQSIGTIAIEMLPNHLKGQVIAHSLNIFDSSIQRYVSIYSSQRQSPSTIFFNLSALMRLTRILTRPIICVRNIQPVAAIRSHVLKQKKFDTIFINGGEDTDLAIWIKLNRFVVRNIDFRLYNNSGSSLGIDVLRVYRNSIPELLYLGYKLKQIYNL